MYARATNKQFNKNTQNESAGKMLKSKRYALKLTSSSSSTVNENADLFPAIVEIGHESILLKMYNLRKSSFDRLLLEAVDEGLSLLGNSVKEAVYFYLEKDFKISRADIPSRLEDFVSSLEKLFGVGAKLIEIRIMEKLYKKVGDFKYFPENGNVVFAEYVAALREHYVKRMLT